MSFCDEARTYCFLLLLLTVGGKELQASSEEPQDSPPAIQEEIKAKILQWRQKHSPAKELEALQTPLARNTVNRSSIRFRRGLPSPHCKDLPKKLKGTCCLDDFEFDYKKMGLPDVLAPEKVNIGRCRGKCVSSMIIKSSENARLRVMKLGSKASLCCAPMSFSKISTLILNGKDSHVKTDMDEIQIASCWCAWKFSTRIRLKRFNIA